MDGRIGVLDLKVRAPASRQAEVRGAAEAFTKRVLRRLDELLERRAPGRIVLVRQLSMRWRLREGALDLGSEVEAVAEEVADALDTQAREVQEARGEPSPEQELVVFDDEAHWRATYLRSVAGGGGRGAWYWAELEREGEAPGALRRVEYCGVAEAVLARLAREGELLRVLMALPTAGVAELAEVVGVRPRDWGSGDGRLPSWLEEGVSRIPVGVSDEVAALYVATEVSVRERTSAGGESDVEVAAAALRSWRVSGGGVTGGMGQGAIRSEGNRVSGGVEASRGTAASDDVVEYETRFGGLFYLLGLALELGIGEILWKACLPEGVVLAKMAAAILGEEGAHDPAPMLFGGVSPKAWMPPVTREQQAEVAVALLAALVEALPRRGLGELPVLVFKVVEQRAGVFLVVTARDRPFVIFAWPITSSNNIGTGLASFLSVWPVRLPEPVLESVSFRLDRRTLYENPHVSTSASTLLGAMEEGGMIGALLAQITGTICQLLVTRVPYQEEAGFVATRKRLTLPARIAIINDTMKVIMGAASIDLGVRRVALDANPGWVPWLEKNVQFEFGPGAGGSHSDDLVFVSQAETGLPLDPINPTGLVSPSPEKL